MKKLLLAVFLTACGSQTVPKPAQSADVVCVLPARQYPGTIEFQVFGEKRGDKIIYGTHPCDKAKAIWGL